MSRKEDKIPATLRSFAVLEALVAAERPASLTSIVESCALPKPTVYRMLAMLESAGLVARDPGAARYSPGPRLAAMGLGIMQNGSLSSARHAILAQLVEQIGETCNFTMLQGGEVMRSDVPGPSRSRVALAHEPDQRIKGAAALHGKRQASPGLPAEAGTRPHARLDHLQELHPDHPLR
jgi:hypothetical protein